MLQQILNTSRCEVMVEGRFEGAEPTVLVIRGVWPGKGYLNDLVDRFPGRRVLLAELPGMRTPAPADSSARLMSAAFDEALEKLAPGGPIVAVGASTGALVTLGLRHPRIGAQVLLEPFARPAELWPLVENLRERMATIPKPILKDYIAQLFGVGPDWIAPHDHSDLFRRARGPIWALVGSDPLLPRRPCDRWPSLVSAHTRALLEARPDTTILELPDAGHNVTASVQGWDFLVGAIEAALRSVEADAALHGSGA